MYRMLTVQLEDETTVLGYSAAELAIHQGDLCVLEDKKVPEFGRVVKLEEIPAGDRPKGMLPVILRRATLQDQSRARENAVVGHMAIETCRKKALEHKLAMRIIGVRYSFDRSLLTVTFTAEERVDFRELIRSLSAELKVRVEMKQMGVRDAARHIGGMASCGRQLCCCAWLRAFDAVSVKMAKTQRLALTPGMISGMCGRLKCCLRYEFEAYRHLSQHLPREKTRVECAEGQGIVTDVNLLTRRVKVCLDDRRIIEYEAAAVKPLREEQPPPPEKEEDDEHEDTYLKRSES
jgi:cell fate regulator YaaT (PSP1 superfamily)